MHAQEAGVVFWELAPRCNRLCWLHEASAEKALEWEHRVETLRIHLRLNSGGKLQASPRTYELFHKGSFLQDPGASYDQVVPQNSKETTVRHIMLALRHF